MEQLRCTYCGGLLQDRGDFYICESCRTKIKKSAMERLSDQDIFDLNAARRLKDGFRFDEAQEAYDEVLRRNPDCEEAAWGAFLTEYGIEYQVEEQKPTFHALSAVPVYKSRYYDRLSPEHQHEADEAIEFKRREVMRGVETLPSYDVFLSLKIDGEDGRRTPEYEWGMQLYYDLREMGYKVFFSPQVLKTTNSDWEPYIYRAIQTCRIMLVLTSSIDNTNAPWVRNEWRRILSRIKNAPQGEQPPAYRVIASDMNCVPPQLSGKQVLLHGDYHLRELIEGAVGEACAAPEEAASPAAGLIQVPQSVRSIKNIQLIKELLRDAGFTNIRDFPLHDMDGTDGYPWEEGALASIMVAGEDYNFDGNAKYFDPGTPVLITYHCVSEEAVAEQKAREEAERKAREEAEQKRKQEQAEQNPAEWFRLGLNAYNLKNYAEAVKWFRKAAEQGDADAQFNLAVCYENGEGVRQDFAEAVKWYCKAAEQGNAAAQNNLGECYYYGRSVAQDYAEAVKWYSMAAEQGNASAQFNLALCYLNGKGVKQDNAEAVKWFRKAAEQGDAGAQFNLALCYEDGEGVRQDNAEAVKWYLKAAEQGDARAQFNLAWCYVNGKGVRQDNEEAVKWYRKAAEQGHAGAQNNLGFRYRNGKGVKQDNAEAVKWYRKAAEQGHADAQNNLGFCYENGKGVRQDNAEAVKWFRKAAEQGNTLAQANLRRLGFKF